MKCSFILAFFSIVLSIGLIGCTPVKSSSPVAPVGTSLDKTTAYVNSAEVAVQQAKPHSDPVGQEDLALASTAHKSARDSLDQARKDLAGVQSALTAKDKQIASLTDSIAALNDSWGHKLQVFTEAFLTLLLILVGLHLVGAVLAMVLPPPYSIIAALVAKVVNPFGWLTWLILHVEQNVAKNVITAPTTPVNIKTVAGTLMSGIAKSL
jgi:hypothetical protein